MLASLLLVTRMSFRSGLLFISKPREEEEEGGMLKLMEEIVLKRGRRESLTNR